MANKQTVIDSPVLRNQEPMSLGEFQGHEIYPMPMFAKLAVADVDKTAAWYENALGFTTVFRALSNGEQTSLVHLRRRKYQDVLLVSARSTGTPSSNLVLNFNADGEVDEIAARARGVASFGASSVEEPVNTPWNTRDLKVIDPAGNRLVFTGRNPNPDPEQAARMRAMFEAGRKEK
jgi:uncharacterized glyoxalase superfamily protein PhnB